MPSPSDSPDGSGFSDSDQQWFDQLAGKPGALADSPAGREGLALRRALQRDAEAAAADPEVRAASTADAEQRRWEALQRRLAQEGLPARTPWWSRWFGGASKTGNTPTAWRRPVGLALAVALAGILVLPPLLTQAPVYDEPPVLRGEPVIVKRSADNARRAAETLVSALQQAGLRAGLYQRSSTYVVDLSLSADELDAAKPGLAALGLQPRLGFTRIEIDTP